MHTTPRAPRHDNRGLRKRCGHPRRLWPKCPHSWYFNFKLRGGPAFRFSVDEETGTHIESKTEADALADSWRNAIRAGTFRRRGGALPATSAVTAEGVTLARFGAVYAERLGKPVSQNHQACFRQFIAFRAPGTETTYGARLLAAFTEDDIEVFFVELQAKRFAESTRNKYVQMVKALFRWATKKGYLTRNPTADSDILKRRKPAQRHRRLAVGEEAKLLEHAGPHLQRVILGALETCARLGELLVLQWRDVSLARRELLIRAEEDGARKTGDGRWLPISARLAAVLEMAQTDPAGQMFDPEAHVFGDGVGRRVKAIKRAWETCVLKAHGHTPTWKSYDLTPDCRQALDAIDLHFHDLRHEAGSRLLEAGWPLHTVSHMLGHANIAQTSTYLNATKVGLQKEMQRLDASRCTTVAQEGAKRAGASVQRQAEEPTQPLVN